MIVSGDVEIENNKKKRQMNPLYLGKDDMKYVDELPREKQMEISICESEWLDITM